MGFENKEEFRPILTTAKELLIASGEVELVKILNSAELSVIQTSYDNWNGGIYYYTMYVNVSVPDFVRLQSCNIEDIEKRILEAINTASRSIDDEVVGQVLITPKSVAKVDWSLLDGISKKDLENKIEYLRNVMVSVATGGQRIQDVEKEYSQIYNQVAISLKKIDVENPNPFKSLWDWYGKWRNDFPKYQERRDYIRKTPNSRIVQYDMGNLTDEFPVSVSLAVKKPAQIRHNSLEAARIASNRLMQRKAGRLGYHLKLRTYPHQIVRENPMATGAGADRVQSGMRNAFGKPISVEAIVKAGQRIITIDTNKKNFEDAKLALKRAGMKLPVSCRIVVDKGEELVL